MTNNTTNNLKVGYDWNGNITTLQRYGRTGASTYGRIDYLTLSYSGNRLSTVKDTGSAAYSNDFRYSNTTSTTYSYTHDAAGRMTKDAAKGISSITWNVLGLPQRVTFSNGNVINYSYAADGTKLRESKTASGTTTTTDYAGTLVLEDGTRSRMLFDGGYVSMSDNAYHFFLTDHVGSVRVVANSNGVAEEYNHYYPLGGLLPTSTSITGIQPVKYQGKEWAGAKGLNLYDFGARRYDPATGRWLSQDPLAEKYYGHSPYLFCAASPINVIDPYGMTTMLSTDVRYNKDGTYTVVGAFDDGDRNIYVVGDDGKRTGETIGTTLLPADFMLTNDKTGEFIGYAKVSFKLNSLTVSGSVQPNSHTLSSIYGADAQRLLDWGQSLFRDEVMRQSPATFYGQLEILQSMSENGEALDFKSSLGLDKYTAISAGITSDGKPIITTLRAVGNMTFGANMRSTKPKLLGSLDWYYSSVMKRVGAYNQSQNNGNGYNPGFPYFGEHSYSGNYIYYGYYGSFY